MGAPLRRTALLALMALLAQLALLGSACSRRPTDRPPQDTGAPQATKSQAEAPISDGTPSGQGAEAAAGETAPGVGPSREILLRREQAPQPQGSPAPSSAPTAASPQEKEEQALLGLPSAAVLPEDFRIGRLGDLLQPQPEVRSIALVARRFLEALARGEVDAELIEASRREDLARSLDYYLPAGDPPVSYRLGVIELTEGDPGQARVNVRLFAASGRAEGELYMTKSSQRWQILDLQVRLAALREPYSRAEERFYPSIYTWGMQ